MPLVAVMGYFGLSRLRRVGVSLAVVHSGYGGPLGLALLVVEAPTFQRSAYSFQSSALIRLLMPRRWPGICSDSPSVLCEAPPTCQDVFVSEH